jgi:NADH-quinone oxidoreductase subunit M
MPHLLLLLLIPLAASLLLFLAGFVPSKEKKLLAFVLSLIPLFVLLFNHGNWVGAEIHYNWLQPLHIEFFLKVDHLSLVFMYLTAVIIPIVILAAPSQINSSYLFFGLVLLLQVLLFSFFSARDLALFTVLWEAMLLPLYFIINIWGGAKRQSAALEFIIYMVAGSVLMIAAILFLYFDSQTSTGTGTFNLDQLSKLTSNLPHAKWLAAIFFLAFSVKTPLFPFHAWLPKAYYEASVPGTILLSALLSKAGIYGFLRIGVELFSKNMIEWSPIFITLAMIGLFYAGLAALKEKDFKKLIAFSSLSHVNFILVGVFIWNKVAQEGAILQSVNHAITITALFLTAGWLEERLQSTSLTKVGGLAKFLPHLCWLTLFFVLSSVALPGTNSFIGEILIFYGFFKTYTWLTLLLGLSIILSVMYMLRYMQKAYFAAPSLYQPSWIDLKKREWFIATPLIILVLWIGIYPTPLLNEIKPAAERIVASAELKESN